MGQENKYRELVKQAAEGAVSAADELRSAIKENSLPRIWASSDRLQKRVDVLKTELAVLHRLAPDQES